MANQGEAHSRFRAVGYRKGGKQLRVWFVRLFPNELIVHGAVPRLVPKELTIIRSSLDHYFWSSLETIISSSLEPKNSVANAGHFSMSLFVSSLSSTIRVVSATR